ncbi:MAG: hypothetical protein AAB433_10325 [Nitrospirota bacterium]|nr:hypothetical protein [Nitrospira sp.]HRB16890.1 hypothetical protein [Nitrospira sp.]
MATEKRTRVQTFVSGAVKADIWVQSKKSSITYAVTVGVVDKKNRQSGALKDIATVTAQAESWIKAHTG